MKKIFTFVVLVLGIMTTTLISCDNEILNSEQPVQYNEESSLKVSALAATTTYYSVPTVGNFTPNSSSNTTLSGICGNYVGGVIKAKVVYQSGNLFTILISKQDGTPFSSGGMAKIKSASVCGGQAGSAVYSAGWTSVPIVITATFTQGITHFYPVLESSSGGVKYFAEPVMVYTSPMYNIKTSYTMGETLGTANGVIVKAAAADLTNSNTLSVQCTEFCNRYYSQVYGKNIVDWGTNGNHATFWYNRATEKGLRQVPNGTTPRVGDILCMSGGNSGNGHVAIIIEVGTGSGISYVKVAQQNAGIPSVNAPNYDTHWQHAIGGGLSYNTLTKTILPPSGYTVDGLLRL